MIVPFNLRSIIVRSRIVLCIVAKTLFHHLEDQDRNKQPKNRKSIARGPPGFGKIAPHDFCRTFAGLVQQGESTLDQIQLSLGHPSIQITEQLFRCEQPLKHALCEQLGLRLW